MMCSLSEPIGGETCQGFSGKAHFSQPSGLHSCSHWPWLQGAKEMRDVMASSPSSIPGPDIQIRAAPNLLYRLIVIRLTNTALLSPVASDLVDARATSMLAFITWWREFAVSARSGTRLHGIYWLVALVETCCCKAVHLRGGHRIVFTHGDLAPRNITVQDGKIVGVVYWEDAGWYPEYWEYVKFFQRSSTSEGDWRDYADEIFP